MKQYYAWKYPRNIARGIVCELCEEFQASPLKIYESHKWSGESGYVVLVVRK